MKLKNLKKIYFNNFVPTKLLHFKRPKWIALKKVILKIRSRRRKKIYNFNKLSVRFRFWNRLKKHFKNKLGLRRILRYYLQGKSFEINIKKKGKRELQHLNIAKHLFSVLNLLKSSFNTCSFEDGKDLMFRKNLYVNDKMVLKNVFLNKGDVLYLKKTKNATKKNVLKFTQTLKFNSYFEYDPYIRTLIIVKPLAEITNNDLSLCVSQRIEIEKII